MNARQDLLAKREQAVAGLQELHFTINYNNKLDARAFTTIRKPDSRWKSGNRLAVYEMRDWFRGVARVWSVRETSLRRLTDEECLLDIGHTKEKAYELFERFYEDYLLKNGCQDAPLVIVTLVKEDDYFLQRELPILESGPMSDYREFRQHRPSRDQAPRKQEAPVLEINLFSQSRL